MALSSPAVVLVPGVGLGDGEAEVALDPGQDRVPYPVHADLLGRDPGEVLAEPPPEIVVTPGGDRLAVGVSQQALAGVEAAPAFAVREQVRHQRGRYGLPAHGLAFLVQPDQALLRVEVFWRKRQGAAAAAGGLGVQPQQQRVQGRVIPGGGGDLGEFF